MKSGIPYNIHDRERNRQAPPCRRGAKNTCKTAAGELPKRGSLLK